MLFSRGCAFIEIDIYIYVCIYPKTFSFLSHMLDLNAITSNAYILWYVRA